MKSHQVVSWILVGFGLTMGAVCHAEYFFTNIVDAAKRGDIHAVHLFDHQHTGSAIGHQHRGDGDDDCVGEMDQFYVGLGDHPLS